MNMRDHINKVLNLEDYRMTVFEESQPVPIIDAQWISNNGNLVLEEAAGGILIKDENDEFVAEWDEGSPSRYAFETLARLIEERSECDFYLLGSMPILNKTRAIAVANSLAHHAI